jgi:hypothetical protein
MLASTLATALLVAGCFDSGSEYATKTFGDGGPSGSPIDAAALDASPGPDTSPPPADFPMSGLFSGSAQLSSSEGTEFTATATATTSETYGNFRGLLELEPESDEAATFEYVLSGELDSSRNTVELELSERRCTSDAQTNYCQTGAIREATVFTTDGEWTGEQFEFEPARIRNDLEQPSEELTPILDALVLEPASGFGPGSGRQAPTGGFRPVKKDGGMGGVSRIPEGETTWEGRVMRSHFLGDQQRGPADCEMTLVNSGDALELEGLTCAGISLVSAPESSTGLRVIGKTFRATKRHGRLQFGLRDTQQSYTFFANRQEDLISGFIVRDDDEKYMNSTEPLSPDQFGSHEIEAAFYLER